MNNFTEAQKKAIMDANAESKYVAFNPNTTSEPVTPIGYTEYYRETAANLVEIIYTSVAIDTGPPAWTPDSISGLNFWVDPSDNTTLSITGSSVNSITCKKTGTVFSQAVSANKPTISPAGGLFTSQSINYGIGTNSWLHNTTGVVVPSTFTAFVVIYWGTRSNTYSGLGFFKGTAPNGFSTGTTGAPYLGWFTGTNSAAASQAWLSSSSNVSVNETTASLNKGAKSLYEFGVTNPLTNATIMKDGVVRTRSIVGTNTFTDFNFTTMGSCDTIYLVNGAFGEILIYDGALSVEDATTIRTYLKDKWGTP